MGTNPEPTNRNKKARMDTPTLDVADSQTPCQRFRQVNCRLLSRCAERSASAPARSAVRCMLLLDRSYPRAHASKGQRLCGSRSCLSVITTLQIRANDGRGERAELFPSGSGVTDTIASPAPMVPFIRFSTPWVQLTGTWCNLECTHCINASGPKSPWLKPLDPDTVHRAILEAEELGAKEIYLAGGELCQGKRRGEADQVRERALCYLRPGPRRPIKGGRRGSGPRACKVFRTRIVSDQSRGNPRCSKIPDDIPLTSARHCKGPAR